MKNYQTILVVDDHEISRLLPGLILRPFGFTVYERRNGFEALQTLKSIPITAVLLDIFMHGISGLDILRLLKNDPKMYQMRIIAYTTIDGEDDINEYLTKGFDAVLAKPITSKKLLELLVLRE